MDFTEDEVKEAKAFGQFYVDKMENHPHSIKYYLSEDIVLDWFGQTVKGEKLVTAFLRKTLLSVNHLLSDAVPARKIGFRDTHIVKIPKEPKLIPLGLMSPPRVFYPKTTQTKTPKKQQLISRPEKNGNHAASCSNDPLTREKGQGDGFHIESNSVETPMSPAKRFKPSMCDSDSETVESECDSTHKHKVKYIICKGAVEFHKPSTKKLQGETKWRRPCKLSVAYSIMNCDYMVYLIIYEGNVKCRRNLMKDFEAEEPEN